MVYSSYQRSGCRSPSPEPVPGPLVRPYRRGILSGMRTLSSLRRLGFLARRSPLTRCRVRTTPARPSLPAPSSWVPGTAAPPPHASGRQDGAGPLEGAHHRAALQRLDGVRSTHLFGQVPVEVAVVPADHLGHEV